MNLNEIIPFEYQILFDPTANELTGMVSYETRCIYVFGDITTPRSVATLMHEIGHIWDQKNLDEHKKKSFMSDELHSEKAEIIRRERAATAFALKQLRPYLKGELRTDVANFLKFHALRSYYDSTKEWLSHDRELAKFWGPDPFPEMSEEWMREEEMLEIFTEWRKTDAYTRWKAHECPKNVDEYEEYGEWREWIEKTQHDYINDLPIQEDSDDTVSPKSASAIR